VTSKKLANGGEIFAEGAPRSDQQRPHTTDEDIQKKEKQRQKSFNGLTASEWTVLSRNIWDDVSSPREPHHLEHGAVYPVKLVSRLVTMYSKKGDWVLDPFLGIGSTVVGAMELQRNAVGIELNPRFANIARDWIEKRGGLLKTGSTEVIQGDCRQILGELPKDKFQLVITSPPYADFIHRSVEDRANTHKTSIIRIQNNSRVKPYGDSPKDFGNLPYDDFLEQLEPVLADCARVTRPGGYQVWVVKDHRDTKAGIPYISVHSDLAGLAKNAGLVFHDLIIWNQNEQRRLVLLGYPSVFYTNQNCSFLVVLRKPQNKKK